MFLPKCFEVSKTDEQKIQGHVRTSEEVKVTLDAVNKEFNTAFVFW